MQQKELLSEAMVAEIHGAGSDGLGVLMQILYEVNILDAATLNLVMEKGPLALDALVSVLNGVGV